MKILDFFLISDILLFFYRTYLRLIWRRDYVNWKRIEGKLDFNPLLEKVHL